MKQIKIQCNTGTSLPLNAFIEFQGDLKELSKENFQKLKKEIEKTGFAFAPHVWRSKKDNKIAFYLIDGHQRIRTLRQMVQEGYECKEVPVVMVEASSMKEAKRRVLQGTSQYGKMTNDGLYEFISENELEFQDVEESFRLPDIDFVDFKDEFFDDPKIDEAADNVPDLPIDPKVKVGDLFMLGNHRLLCGDSTDATQVERLMNGEKADMVFTDPPYGIKLDTNYTSLQYIKIIARFLWSGYTATKSVVDLFGDSGLIACEKTNRKCLMMELDPQHCQVIIERWQKYANKEAIREDGIKFNAIRLQN